MFCLNQIWMCFNSLLSVLVFYKHWDLGLSKLDYFGFSSLNTATVYRNALRCWVVCLFKCLFLVFYIYVRVIHWSGLSLNVCSVFAVPLRAEWRRQGAGRFCTGGSGCSHLIPSQGQIWVFIPAFLSMSGLLMLCFALVLSPFVKDIVSNILLKLHFVNYFFFLFMLWKLRIKIRL